MASLSEERKGWEKKCTVIVEVPVVLGVFRKLYVVIRDRDGEFILNRYWESTLSQGDWMISVDIKGGTLDQCLEHIKQDKDVKDMVAGLSVPL